MRAHVTETPPIRTRGIRGATTVDRNTREAILEATHELLATLIDANKLCAEDVAMALFSTTADLNAEFPAVVARRDFGWDRVALECVQEMPVPGSLALCIRVTLVVNTALRQDEVSHIFLRGARALRPDLVPTSPA